MRHPDIPTDLTLSRRKELPEDLLILLARYPREVWEGHENLGQLSRFWLDRHTMFRDLIAAMGSATGELREGTMSPADFRPWFVPRFNFFLGQLETHHQIEDHHYFPVFVKAEARLQRGFDLLENDHDHIHERLIALHQAGLDLDRGLREGGDPLKRAAEAVAGEIEKMIAGLARHLADEEDLIVPVILDQGERRLGLW